MFDLPDSAILYADSALGVYVPQYFAESIRRECVTGVSQKEWDILAHDPNADDCPEWYLDTWNDVEQNAIVTDSNGAQFRLYQDGDLWLVPADWTPCDD